MIKFADFNREKTEKFKKKFHKKNLEYNEIEDYYVCPNGKKLIKVRDYNSSKYSKYPKKTTEYQCESYEDCPFKSLCTKAKGNRSIHTCKKLVEYEDHARDLLNTERGKELRKNLCIQAEGTFGIIKNNHGYVRLHRRTLIKVKTEVHLVAIGFNLAKYHNIQLRKLAENSDEPSGLLA